MKNILIILISLLNFTLFSQDTIGLKKNYINFHIYKGIGSAKPYIIEGITPELKNTLKTHNEFIKTASQADSLIVFFGVTYTYPFKYNELNGKKTRIPNSYYRLVISLTTHNVISCILFSNSIEPILKKVTISELQNECKFFFERKLGYTLHEIETTNK